MQVKNKKAYLDFEQVKFYNDSQHAVFIDARSAYEIQDDRIDDLNKIISRSVNLHELTETGINFILPKEKLSNSINGDEEQLNRVFINLIKNSIESINEKKSKNVDFKGKISIDIKGDSDYIYVTIVDNGVGFEQVDKTKMLTPYFTTKKKEQV